MATAKELNTLIKSYMVSSNEYGGLSEVSTYYRNNTEYEVGLHRAIESLRCILGSLYRIRVRIPQYGLEKSIQFESGHIEEEIGITRYVLKEYSSPVYTDERHFLDSKYKDDSISQIIKGSALLKKETKKLLSQVKGKEEIDTLTKKIYETIISFAEAALKNTSAYGVKNNLYKDQKLIRSVNDLYKSIVQFLQV